jgi:glutathione synthase
MSQILLWVTDPWNTLAHSQDTTLRLHQEALNMGVPSYWSGSDFTLNPLSASRLAAQLNPCADSTKFVELEPSKIRQLHYRVDPPVNSEYLDFLEKVVRRIGSEKPVLSPPSILRSQSEKVPPPALAHHVPTMTVVSDAAGLAAAFALFQGHDRVVTKPMNEAQSKGVKLWDRAASGLDSLDGWIENFSKATSNFSEQLVIQEYLPGVHLGETRMWFAAGQFIAALKKHPKSGDFRVLIDEGSKVEAYTLTSQERDVAEEVGETLRQQGVALAAIDFIDGKISDYNITSPGLLVQLEKVHGKNYAREVLNAILSIK